jgi:uncharacterized protein (TIGR02271 family)
MSNPSSTTSSSSSISWDDVRKKEARGVSDDYDFGEVQEVGSNYVVTQRGLVSKEKFYLPKYLVQGYDGDTLWFNITEDQARTNFMRDSPPQEQEYSKYKETAAKTTGREYSPDIETRIPVMAEKLGVAKTRSQTEATITKEPITETKTVEVPVTHEELSVERRPASGETTATDMPVDSRREIKVPLNKEEVQVTKQPYVKEEVVVKKEPVTETRTVSDTVRSEKVNVASGEEKVTDEEER